MEIFKKINFKLIGATLLPLVGSFALSLIAGRMDRDWYNSLKKPYLNPPSWIFAPVWTSLYLMMGFASYLVYKAGGESITGPSGIPLLIYGVQLIINWAWSPIFFGFKQIVLAFYTLVVLCVGVAITMVAFYRLSKVAALLLLPYMTWVSFASYLSYQIMELNKNSTTTIMGLNDMIM